MTSHIICATLPRSGHQLLGAIMSAYLGDDLYHCFKQKTCCGAIPCTASVRPLTLRKAHDERLYLDIDAAGTLYVVHYREPMGHVLSYAEWMNRRNMDFSPGDPNFIGWWLAMTASAMIAFLEKWHPPRQNRMHVPYHSLIGDPAAQVCAVLERAGVDVDISRLRRRAGEVAQFKARPATKPGMKPERYVPRDMTMSKVVSGPRVQRFVGAVRARTAFVDWPEDAPQGEDDVEFLHQVDLVGALVWGKPGGDQIAEAAASSNPWMRKLARRVRA